MRLYFLTAFLLLMLNANKATAQITSHIYCAKAGALVTYFTEAEANEVVNLTLTGKINAVDFRHLRDEFKNLQFLDISNVQISFYMGKDGTCPNKNYMYSKNSIPAYAFCKIENNDSIGKSSLTQVYLSEKIVNIGEGAFKNCANLAICRIGKKTAPSLQKDGLDPKTTAIFVPLGARDDYTKKQQWESFAFVEGNPKSTQITVGASETLYENLLKAGVQPADINFLFVEGKLDAADMKIIRDYMPNLVHVDLSRTSATEIPEFTFAQKKYMLSINLPVALKSIGERAFSGCTRLSRAVVLPNTVTSLGYGAFMGCETLAEVIVTGEALTSVGDNLFGESRAKLVYRK